jgi:hypothetical protein
MKAVAENEKALLRQVIRGERAWPDLAQIGITMQLEDPGIVADQLASCCSVKNARNISFTADIHDLARGLVANRDNPKSLREWAMFIQASDVDLQVEDHPEGDVVLDAIWDAAFLNPIKPEAMKILERLAS